MILNRNDKSVFIWCYDKLCIQKYTNGWCNFLYAHLQISGLPELLARLSSDLALVTQWKKFWLVKFNTSKIKLVTFHHRWANHYLEAYPRQRVIHIYDLFLKMLQKLSVHYSRDVSIWLSVLCSIFIRSDQTQSIAVISGLETPSHSLTVESLYADLWVMDYFPPFNPIFQKLQTSRCSIVIFLHV